MDLGLVNGYWTGTLHPLEIISLRVPRNGGTVQKVNVLEQCELKVAALSPRGRRAPTVSRYSSSSIATSHGFRATCWPWAVAAPERRSFAGPFEYVNDFCSLE